MNFKQLKPQTQAAFRAGDAKIRSMQSTSAQAKALAAATQKSRTTAPKPRVGRLARGR